MRDHTNLGYPSVQAMYLDDQMSGWTVVNNTVIDAQMGLMVGGGRDNIVQGNRFVGCDVAIHVDPPLRGGRAAPAPTPLGGWLSERPRGGGR
jgi:hypothetical protein